jgi:hypothetical protein
MAIRRLCTDRNRDNKLQNRNNQTPSEYSVQHSHTLVCHSKSSLCSFVCCLLQSVSGCACVVQQLIDYAVERACTAVDYGSVLTLLNNIEDNKAA